MEPDKKLKIFIIFPIFLLLVLNYTLNVVTDFPGLSLLSHFSESIMPDSGARLRPSKECSQNVGSPFV